jgi:hypothetical protein
MAVNGNHIHYILGGTRFNPLVDRLTSVSGWDMCICINKAENVSWGFPWYDGRKLSSLDLNTLFSCEITREQWCV